MEKLTEEEIWAINGTYHGPKLIRIIDELTVKLNLLQGRIHKAERLLQVETSAGLVPIDSFAAKVMNVINGY